MQLTHPAFPDMQRDVPDGDADRWIAAGWLTDNNLAHAADKLNDLLEEENDNDIAQ